ncbi:MAG: RDD family protein [Thermoanaerobaculia bacterium]
MSYRNTPDETPGLFDLPLDPEPHADDLVAPAPLSVDELPIDEQPVDEQPPAELPIDEVIPPDALSLFEEDLAEEPVVLEEPVDRQFSTAGPALAPAPVVPRLLAGLIDLGILLSVAVSVWIGLRLLGVQVDSTVWLPVAIFLLSFSFLYYVFPLAFWGRTPGMSLVGLVARTPDNRPLTFGQTALRWLGTLGTAAGLGLPILLTLFGDSFTDRVSGSRTLIRPVAKWG